MAVWYLGSTKYTSVAQWAASTAYTAGNLVRQLAAPAVGNERVFACIASGTSGGSEPAWTLTAGAKTTGDGSVSWIEVTGQAAVNGDSTNPQNWTNVKNTAVSVGKIIKNNSGTIFLVCTTAGTTGNGSEPAWNTAAGQTTTDNTAVWTSLGAVGNFSAWGAPHARLRNVFASGWMSGSDTCYASPSHAETNSATTNLGAPGGSGFVNNIICTPDTVAPPTSKTTGASITTTGASDIALSAVYYYYGFTFNVGTGSSAANFTVISSSTNVGILDNCTINLLNTAVTSFIRVGNVSSTVPTNIELINCTYTFSAAGQSISPGFGLSRIRGGTFAATGTIPTSLFVPASQAKFEIRDTDLSNINTNYVDMSPTIGYSSLNFIDCKLNASATLTTGTIQNYGTCKVRLHNCDNGNTNYKFFEKDYNGSTTQETTNVRTGGATDGTTPVSFNLQSTSKTTLYFPYEAPEIVQWNDTTGSSLTATVEIASNNTLTNADIWMEIEYLGDSATPKGSFVDNRAADIFATPSNVATSAAVWGGSTTTKQKLQVSFTPQQKGYVKARIKLAKTSQQVYVDPLMAIA